MKIQIHFQLFFLFFVNVAQAVEISTPLIQGAMVIGKTAVGNKIHFLGREVRVNEEGIFVVGLGRDAPKKVNVTETFPSGKQEVHRFAVKQRSYKEQRIEGVPKRTVQVPEAELPRIRKEVKLTKSARNIDSKRKDFLQSFIWPTKGVITGVYGSRRFYNGEPRRPHFGIDIAAPKGSLVWAPISGKVTLVHNDMYFSGGTLIIDHGHGVSSTFIHLSEILVEEGDEIEQGGVIAKVGSTGRSTGPHLDWRINWFEQRLDPQLLMDGPPEKLTQP